MEPGSKIVYVVDDIPEILRFFEDVGKRLAPQGIQIVTESDSKAALERLKDARFDVIISDYRMRDVDGVTLLTASRNAHPAAARMLMTGYNEIPAPLSRIREARVDAYLQKPLRTQDLMLLILDFINQNETTIEAFRKQARELEAIGGQEEARR